MKAVMISIRPKWVAKILSGEKTVEVRKTAPNLETPFRCYIYETQGKTDTPWIDEEGHMIFRGRGQVVAEFICDEIRDARECFIVPTCLTTEEWLEYTNGYKRTVWGWHISELKIFDKPKELHEFNQCHKCEYHEGCVQHEYSCAGHYKLQRPPQSWCYVEELQ